MRGHDHLEEVVDFAGQIVALKNLGQGTDAVGKPFDAAGLMVREADLYEAQQVQPDGAAAERGLRSGVVDSPIPADQYRPRHFSGQSAIV